MYPLYCTLDTASTSNVHVHVYIYYGALRTFLVLFILYPSYLPSLWKMHNSKYKRMGPTRDFCYFYVPEPYLMHFTVHIAVDFQLFCTKGCVLHGIGMGCPFQGPKKSRFIRPTPAKVLLALEKWFCPHQNHYFLLHINNRYIKSWYM